VASVRDKVNFYCIYGLKKSLIGDSYVQIMEENPSASRRIRRARKSTIADVTLMKIKADRHKIFKMSNRICHEDLFSPPVIQSVPLVDITAGDYFLGLCDQKVHINMCPILDS